MREAVIAANPQLLSFDILRAGDDITLLASARHGSDRVDFRLLGTKHDYYRVSMGVRLEETAAILARADPNLASAGVETRGEAVVLRFAYSGATIPVEPAASANPLASPAPSARKAAAADRPRPSGPPPGAEEEVSVPRAGQLPGVTPAVTESAAPPVPAPTTGSPASPTAADEANDAYQAAAREDTLPAWSRFLERYPEASQADAARRRAAVLREEAAYRTALERNDPAGYRAFLDHFPDSTRQDEITARLRVVEESRRVAAAEKRATEATERRRQTAYSEARKLDTPEAYRIFLTVYPEAPEAREARQRLERALADDQAFEAARGSTRRLKAYLAERRNGRHAEEAQRLLDERRRAEEENDFRSTASSGSEDAWERFLARWPDSARAPEARQALAALRRRAPPGPSEGSGATPLVAPRVENPPTVDGSALDPVWERAPVAELPLTAAGEKAPKTLRVRAVHDGKSLYLLAEWADPSGDKSYRPWVWDPTRESYYQSEQLDDGLAVTLYRTAPAQACMLSGADLDADAWMWRAFWSEISGLADDGEMRVSRTRIPQSNPYPVVGGGGQVWVQEGSDRGRSGWFFFIPVEFQGYEVPSYQAQEATGSRADVRARGHWAAAGSGPGIWTVELARALDTGQSDDVALAEGGSQPVAFAVFDKGDKGRHASSALVQLELRRR